jgi:hypothetical protein
MIAPEVELGSIGGLFLAMAALWARMEHRFTKLETRLDYTERDLTAVRSGSAAPAGRSVGPLNAA